MVARKIGWVQDKIAPPRFVAFALVLVATAAIAGRWHDPARAFIIAFDTAAGLFMLSLYPLLRYHTPDEMRQHAAENDANRVLLLAVSVVVTLAILASVALELGGRKAPSVPLVVGTLSLAWLFGNTVFAIHYAHLYYFTGREGGLDFAGDHECPDYSDFFYFAYTLGMSFATSDTAVESRQMRRIVTCHALAAFAFNIGVLAFSVNVLSGGRG